jgi:hypothetical protein
VRTRRADAAGAGGPGDADDGQGGPGDADGPGGAGGAPPRAS